MEQQTETNTGYGLEVDLDGDRTTATVTMQGEIDTTAAPLLRSTLERLAESGVERVRLAMQDVTLLDSTGISAIAHLLRRDPPIDVKVVAASRPVSVVLRAVGLTGVLGLDR